MVEVGNWYVLYVRSCQEKRANSALSYSGIESYLPLVEEIRQWSDRKKKVIKPLLPSYLFVKINSKRDIHFSKSADGVVDFVKFGSEYAKINVNEIDKIKSFLSCSDIEKKDSTYEMPVKGQKMRIVLGPLKGLECQVDKSNSHTKVFVTINALRMNLTAHVPVNYLTSV
jgi:transcription antitermination factor NusG